MQFTSNIIYETITAATKYVSVDVRYSVRFSVTFHRKGELRSPLGIIYYAPTKQWPLFAASALNIVPEIVLGAALH